MNELENAYERGTFGVSRRTFMKLAGIAGVTAMGGMLVFPDRAYGLYTEPTIPIGMRLPVTKCASPCTATRTSPNTT